MNKLLKTIAFLTLVLGLNMASFAQKSTTTGKTNMSTVNVTILNNTFTHVDLINAYGNDKTTYASADISNDRFTMKLDLKNDIYRFDFGDDNFLLIVLKPGETINMTVDAEDLQSIVSVTGSPSMDFVKEAASYSLRKKVVLDSLNKALQSDEQQKYWSRQAQQMNQYTQTNADVDRYILAAFDNVDTLKALMDRYVSKGKVKGSNVETFSNALNKTLKDLDRNYRPFANYLENVDKYYDFSDKGSAQYKEYFAMRTNYIDEVNGRYDRAERYLGKQMENVTQLIAIRDSLSYNNLLDKGKNQLNWAMQVVEKFQPVVDDISREHVAWHRQVDINQDVPQNLVEQSQMIVKKIVSGYQNQYNENESYLNGKLKEVIRANKNDVAVLMFLDMFPREQNAALHEEVITALHGVVPDHLIVKERWNYMNSPASKTGIGAIAPELEFPNPEGKMLKLSDLRGKVVILDFWASWCGPCRRESPNVRRIYQTYHDKGLEVFSVSLDSDGNAWRKAIVDDQLVWPNHVSDLKKWQSAAAAIYGVRSIPAIFVLDRDGRIVAKDVRGQELERVVKQLLEK